MFTKCRCFGFGASLGYGFSFGNGNGDAEWLMEQGLGRRGDFLDNDFENLNFRRGDGFAPRSYSRYYPEYLVIANV